MTAKEWIEKQDTKYARTLREKAKYIVAMTLPYDIPAPVIWWDVVKIANGLIK